MASARSGNALGPIQRLFDEGTLTGLTDAQLLDRFLTGRDESAFAFLVARHGPMVLAVCRGVLRDRNDAEDAFQATFLVLFRKAGGLRAAGSLGSWLYRVAYRIALRANAVAARRRERSSEEDVMAAEAASTSEAGVDRELLPIIHAEIDRLPDRYRAPIAVVLSTRTEASPTNRPRTSSAGRSGRSAAGSPGRETSCVPGWPGAVSPPRPPCGPRCWPARPRRRRRP